ncbi:MAG: nickel-dependent hydrogenase large subunit [Ideonella sp.]|nr:nickel-dependent hydrogenase large subunit [Ideonella sp.]
MSRLIVGPFNRVEGDLEVQLEVADGQVVSARVVSPMYRGFETMLQGRAPNDALVIVPRICGICSVSQSVAAARALADAAGVTPPPNGQHAINLMLGTENAADHLSHFYLFFMPDFTRAVYDGRPWVAEARRRFAALAGEHARQAIAARQRWFELMGTLGGKWPHTQSVLPGGSSRAIDAGERLRLLARLREFRGFIEDTLYGAPIEEVLALDTEAALQAWQAQDPLRGDLRLWLTIAADTGMDRLGPGPDRLISVGGFAQADGTHWFARGLWQAGAARALDLGDITEDATHAWLDEGNRGPRHPAEGLTQPTIDKPAGYTWNKAPRLAGQVVETGALARQLIAGQPLLRALHARCGATVHTRVLGRLIELGRILVLMEQTLAAIVPREPFHTATHLPDQASGVGLTEAARGALGHWLRVERGRIAHYQIVAPTSWNFSPRDAGETPGALEAALVGASVLPGETTPVAVQHIVRSFDPCMVCTVH